MLVLTGYTLEHVTCGIFKAAPHNVVSTARHAHMQAFTCRCVLARSQKLMWRVSNWVPTVFVSVRQQSITMPSY